MFCDNSIALTNGFVDVGLGQVDLVLVLLLVLGELGALEVGLDLGEITDALVAIDNILGIYILTIIQICIHFQVLAIIMERIALWTQ